MLFDAIIVIGALGAIGVLIYRVITGTLPKNFGKLELHSPWVFVFALAMQLLVVFTESGGSELARKIFPIIYVVSFLVLLLAALKNRHLFGVKIAAAGVAMNLLVVAANGGQMPADIAAVRMTGREDLAVAVETGQFLRHQPISESTRLTFLADVLILPKPYPRPCVFSVGDIFITFGGCWLVLNAFGFLPVNFKRRRYRSDEVVVESHSESL